MFLRNVGISGAVPCERKRKEGKERKERRSRKPLVEECSYNYGLGCLGGKTWSFGKIGS